MGNLTTNRNSTWSPLREIDRMRSEFDRLMQEMMGSKSALSENNMSFSPSCEFAEDDKNFVVKFDMPGVKKDQVKIEIDKNILTVSAERSEEKVKENKRNHYSEVNYGSYFRSFTLPTAVDEKKIDAKLSDGVLSIVLPKTEKAQSKQIEIH